jgi:hypothetical protein
VYAEGDHTAQKQTMNGINKVYATLALNPVYRDKLIILCDTPHADKQTDFDKFMTAYPALTSNNQLFIIPTQALEEYYPAPWTTSATDNKRRLAQEVGDSITKDQFETDMTKIHEALTECWSKSY